ncbi:MAG: hypothetical protein JNM09_05145 [Blastocatellia bacterium]|nr:hypothetical protein [Blastocatellia bacterium]
MLTLAHRQFLSLILATIFTLALPLQTRADNGFAKPWTTVASAGTVDEADLNKVNYSEATARLNLATPANTTAVIRYNVVALDGLVDAGGDGYSLAVRFRDNGQDERVIVRLKAVDLNTGIVTTLMTLDSNAFAPNALFQLRSVPVCWPNWNFNFNRNAYFVEAILWKGTTAGNPGLTAVQISKTIC